VNWVHPPLAKEIMGLGWLILTKLLGIVAEPTVFRLVSALFGLWALQAVRAWMRALGFSETAAHAAVWLTGFNFIWFVQSRTAMLDIFYVAFSLWGTFYIYTAPKFSPRTSRRRLLIGGVLLGAALSSKWAALPFCAVALFYALRNPRRDGVGVASAVGLTLFTYWATFIPMAFLKERPIELGGFIRAHETMLGGFDSIAAANHPYLSHWWEWPTLLRPMWFMYEQHNGMDQGIWESGNPLLFWVALPCLVAILWFALKKKEQGALGLALLYWIPLLFWAVAPRKLQMFYYYLAPSFMVGPIVVWAHEKLNQRYFQDRFRSWVLIGFTALCALLFFYFLPIMDARELQPGLYLKRYMWFRNWI
jgi:dolichyl-phosphate-mannose--protein O-mannosyl transferase